MEINENLLKKIKNDRFYSKVYEKYKDFNLLIDAGFIDSQVEAKDFYKKGLESKKYHLAICQKEADP